MSGECSNKAAMNEARPEIKSPSHKTSPRKKIYITLPYLNTTRPFVDTNCTCFHYQYALGTKLTTNPKRVLNSQPPVNSYLKVKKKLQKTGD